ncbi:MAG: hypothetical protein IT177_03975 [Acidobacteria bacterium]|nr:hypothetical protein [Acidobacteriota bacterium]
MAGAVPEGDIDHDTAPDTLSTTPAEAPISRWLGTATRWSVAILLALTPLPLLIGEGPGTLAITAAFAAATTLLAGFERGPARGVFVQLAVIGLAVRGIALLLLAWLESASRTVVLGPDGVGFLRAIHAIVNAGFALPRPSFELFATYDTAHLYLFAGVVGTLGPGLLNLHAVNCALTALLGPLTFGWVRLVAPAAALPVGLLVTFYPSIIYLAATDLWKDPSVIAATTLGLWALAHIVHGKDDTWRLAGFTALAGGALWFVHASRFYALWYLEVGVAAIAVLGLLRGWAVRRGAAVAVLSALAVAEAGPVMAGWPASPLFFVASIAQATNATSLRYYSAGLLDEVAEGGRARPNDGFAIDTVDLGLPERANILQVDTDTASAVPGRFGLVGGAVQIGRRVLGPFIWVPPAAWTPRAVLAGDYLLYPGMLFWYVLLPGMLVGLAVTAGRIFRGQAPFMLGVVWVFTVLYWAQFLVINLPYRQREALFPVLALFAWLGFEELRQRSWAGKMYVFYWIALVGLALAHTAIRLRVVG